MDDFLLSHHGFYFHAFLQLIYFHSFNCYDEKLVPYKVINDIQEDDAIIIIKSNNGCVSLFVALR